MAVQWTKAALLRETSEINSDIDTINTQLTVAQKRTLQSLKDTAAIAVKVFVQVYQAQEDTQIVRTEVADRVLEILNKYFEGVLCHFSETYPPPPSSMLCPTVQLFHVRDRRCSHPLLLPSEVRYRTPGKPEMYTYRIPPLPNWLVTISIENLGRQVTLQQRCVPTHGTCLDEVTISPGSTKALLLRHESTEPGMGFDIVDHATGTANVLMRLRFVSARHPDPELTVLLDTLRRPQRLYTR